MMMVMTIFVFGNCRCVSWFCSSHFFLQNNAHRCQYLETRMTKFEQIYSRSNVVLSLSHFRTDTVPCH
uniref:Putative secreted protein n=1 Tax=Anopheles triannulatus TaxID=58253 RepID=A0A2M4B0W4_9DIPT